MDHYCNSPKKFPLDKFHQKGTGRGRQVLLVGESPAANGWRISGKACYTPEGKLLPTGKRLNELLEIFGLSVEICGFTELSKCYVGSNRSQLFECGKKCWPIFLKQIKDSEYRLIILLGVETLRIFNYINDSTLKTGNLTKIKLGNKVYSLLPIYHPSPINPSGRVKNREIFSQTKEAIIQLVKNDG